MSTTKISACYALGGRLRDKLKLALFGLLAPPRERANKRWWRLGSRFIPKLWLRPKKLNGLRLLIQPSDWSQTVIFEEVFLQSSYDLDKLSFTPELILDCGAHIGTFSLLAKSRFPGSMLKAYEPNPQNAEFVRKQIAKNGLDIQFFECAISIETKELHFAISNSHHGTLQHDPASPGTCKVHAIDFIETFQKFKPRSLLLKMDVEGEERLILPMLVPLLPQQTALFFETHAGEAGWREMAALLQAAGFLVEQVNARGQFYDGFAQRNPAPTKL